MGMDAWFKEDIRNLLLSINISSAATARWSNDSRIVAYRQGYQAALVAVAIACGIQPDLIGLGSDYEYRPVPTSLIAPDDLS
jgi:hypothetical protein